MKLCALFLPLAILASSCSSDPYDVGDKNYENTDANIQNVPIDLIAALPARINSARLQPNTNPYEYLNQLGLGPWSDNLARQEKFNSYFLPLSTRHILQIRCSLESLTITEQDAQAIQAGHVLSSSPQWLKDPVVIGATLREDWGRALAHKTY